MSYDAGPNEIINTEKYVPINWFYQFLKTPLQTCNITTIKLIRWGIWDRGWNHDFMISPSCWDLTPSSLLTVDRLVKTFQMMYKLTCFWVIKFLVYSNWGVNLDYMPKCGHWGQKNAKHHFCLLKHPNFKDR